MSWWEALCRAGYSVPPHFREIILKSSHWWIIPFHFPRSFFQGTPEIQMMDLMDCSYQFLVFLSCFPLLLLCFLGEFLNLIFPFFYWVFQYCKDFYYSHVTVILWVFLSNSIFFFCFSVSMVYLIFEATNGSFVSIFFFLCTLCVLQISFSVILVSLVLESFLGGLIILGCLLTLKDGLPKSPLYLCSVSSGI